MKLAKKLVSYLHRVFNKDPQPFLALQIAYAGGAFTWQIVDQAMAPTSIAWDDGVTAWDEVEYTWDMYPMLAPGTTSILTFTPANGAMPLIVDLSLYTVAELGAFIAAQPGYAIPYQDTSPYSTLSALVLLNGVGNSINANGNCLFGYTSLTWAFIDAYAAELETAKAQIANMPAQMNPLTASGSWVDLLGQYFNVSRQTGELDAQYGPRIIATVIRPLGNNIAIAEALRAINGGLAVTVSDYDGLTNNSYGLFDVEFSVSLALLNVTTPANLTVLITTVVGAMRLAGTFMRTLSIITPVQACVYVAATVRSGATTRVYPAAAVLS